MTNAKIRYTADKEFSGKFGPRINVVAETDDGTQAKIWENAGHWISTLEKGQRVNVYQDKNGNWQISKPTADTAPAHQNGSTPRAGATLSTMNKEEKIQLDNELQAYAKLHARCWQLAGEMAVPEGTLISEEATQKIAATLFIQAVRRYAL